MKVLFQCIQTQSFEQANLLQRTCLIILSVDGFVWRVLDCDTNNEGLTVS
jgi:hypothetical protein